MVLGQKALIAPVLILLTLLVDTLTYTLLNRIETAIDDLLLPYTVDLSLYTQIDNPDLQDHIQRVGQLFYQRDEI